MIQNNSITVFTPTYNRAYLLPVLYDSLCTQTCKDFVWLVIDDGSSDDTESLVKGWIDEKKIKIDYAYKKSSQFIYNFDFIKLSLTDTALLCAFNPSASAISITVGAIFINPRSVNC